MNLQPTTPEREALPQRRAAAGAEDSIRGTPFLAAYHVAVAHVGKDLVEAACRRAGVEEGPISPLRKYPLQAFLRFEEEVAAQMAPHVGGYEKAIFLLGAAAADEFFDSVAGRTMKVLAGREPHRMLAAAPNGYQVLVNYGKRNYMKTGERSGRFSFTGELLGPVHSWGIFDAALRLVYEIQPQVTLTQSSSVDFDFDIAW